MPAPVTITDEQIHVAGQHIAAAGRRVTAYNLRAELGGRGEPRRLMAVWQHSFSSKPTRHRRSQHRLLDRMWG